jgi:hypothetical protein
MRTQSRCDKTNPLSIVSLYRATLDGRHVVPSAVRGVEVLRRLPECVPTCRRTWCVRLGGAVLAEVLNRRKSKLRCGPALPCIYTPTAAITRERSGLESSRYQSAMPAHNRACTVRHMHSYVPVLHDHSHELRLATTSQ